MTNDILSVFHLRLSNIYLITKSLLYKTLSNVYLMIVNEYAKIYGMCLYAIMESNIQGPKIEEETV